MKALDAVKRNKGLITVVLALGGIAVMAYYDYCDTTCSYLTGDIWGIDLKWIGIVFMSAVICFTALKWWALVRAALAAGLGVEVFLFSFQVKEDVFCPFCLVFALIVIAAFITTYESSDRLKGSWGNKFLYALGDFSWPPLFKPKAPLILFSLLGYLFVLLTFNGTAAPAYADAGKPVPSWGSGNYEMLIFSDYFCPPCQSLEPQLEPALEALFAHGGVKIMFVDVPIHRQTVLFNRYYLYAVNADPDFKKILRTRRTMFQFANKSPEAKNGREEDLADLFKKEHIAFKPLDHKQIQSELSKLIKGYKIQSTPTCIIKYSESDIRRHVGVPEIMDGIKALKAALKNGKKS